MDKIKTGLAAYGMSGQVFHAPFISTNPHFELTAITERSKNLARERYPDARTVRSFDELVDMTDLELIVVNTPDSSHYEYARRALEAGKHVIVEKPFTQTVEEANELVALADRKGLTLSVYQNRRWDSDFLTVKEVLEKKLLGRLVEFESTFPRFRNFIKQGTWKETGEAGGGITYNLGGTRNRSSCTVVRHAGSCFCRYCYFTRQWPGGRLFYNSPAQTIESTGSEDHIESQLSDV